MSTCALNIVAFVKKKKKKRKKQRKNTQTTKKDQKQILAGGNKLAWVSILKKKKNETQGHTLWTSTTLWAAGDSLRQFLQCRSQKGGE